MTIRTARCLLIPLAVVVGTPYAQTDRALEHAEVQAERARLAASRQVVERRYQEAVEACQNKFAVSACANEARGERRSALSDLRRQEQSLNADERKRKASEASSRIERRLANPSVSSNAGTPRASSSRPRLSEPRPVGAPTGGKSAPSQIASDNALHLEHQHELTINSRRETSKLEARARADAMREAGAKAAQKREAHEQRKKQRRGQRAAPLPDPAPGASAPGKGHGP